MRLVDVMMGAPYHCWPESNLGSAMARRVDWMPIIQLPDVGLYRRIGAALVDYGQ